MNTSNQKLRTIDTDQAHMSTLQQSQKQKHKQFTKQKKQSSRKISLKQSAMKQYKDQSINQIVSKHKKSHHQISSSIQQQSQLLTDKNISSNNKSKIIREIQHLTTSSHKYSQDNNNSRMMQPKYSKHNIVNNNNINNKSLIFSEQKLTNLHNYSVLKGGSNLKLNKSNQNNSNKLKSKSRQHHVSMHNSSNTQQQHVSNKKHSMKGSTTKKHSKSVYNYTQFDQYPLDRKKHSTKEVNLMGGRKSRDSHNRSALTQHHQHNPHHQISTSSITKRVNKSKQTLNKLLNNSSIKKTTNNFKILSNCLKAYIQEQEMTNNKIDVGQIIKMVKAFNKTQIGQVSRPLQELVCEIVGLIQVTLQKEKQQQVLGGFKKDKKRQEHEVKFQTPQRWSKKHQQTFPSSIHQHKTSDFDNHQESQIILTPNDISKTKKFTTSQNHNISQPQQIHQSSLSKDLIIMQQGLQQLKSQSKHLQKIIRQSSSKKKQHKSKQEQSQEQEQQKKQEQIQQKKIEIHRLKQILQRQKYLMDKIENLSQAEQEGQSSELESGSRGGVVREE